MSFRPVWACLAFALAGLSATACSTIRPVETHRKGLFDEFSQMRAAHHGTAEGVAADRKPGGFLGAPDDGPHAGLPDEEGIRKSASTWVWPLSEVTVTSHYGRRGRNFHEGVDLRAPSGTSVYAVEEGRVLYAGAKIRGYGRMVVVKHDSGLSTVYAHNTRLLVRKGQRVRRGDRIAISGKTGHATGAHLHFEIRYGVAAIDPEELLPNPELASNRPPVPAPARAVAAASTAAPKRVRRLPQARSLSQGHKVAQARPVPATSTSEE